MGNKEDKEDRVSHSGFGKESVSKAADKEAVDFTSESRESVIEAIDAPFESLTDERKFRLFSAIRNISEDIDMIAPLVEEIGNEDLLKKIREFQTLFGNEEAERIYLRLEEFYVKVTAITSKIQRSIEKENCSYIADVDGRRGDEFIEDVFNLFRGLENRYSQYVKADYLDDSEAEHYRLIERTSLSIQAYLRMRLGMREWDVLGGVVWKGVSPDEYTEEGINNLIEKCSNNISSITYHYGDLADEQIEMTIIRRVYDLISSRKFIEAKKELRLLAHHIFIHQYKTMGSFGVSSIHKSLDIPMDSIYSIDLENSSDPIRTIEILFQLLTRLISSVEAISQVNSMIKK